jgi:hypothetical protein
MATAAGGGVTAKMGVDILLLNETETTRYNELRNKVEDEGEESLSNEEKKELISLGMRETYVRKEAQWTSMSEKFDLLKDLEKKVMGIDDHLNDVDVNMGRKISHLTDTCSELKDSIKEMDRGMKGVADMKEEMTSVLKEIRGEMTKGNGVKGNQQDRRSLSSMTSPARHNRGDDTLYGDLDMLEYGHEDISSLVNWPPDQVRDSAEDEITWATALPKETQPLIKRLRQENQIKIGEKDLPGKDYQRIRDLAKEVATHSIAHKLPGHLVLTLFRECLDGELRNFFDSLREVHGVNDRNLWFETQRCLGMAYTEVDAIKDLNELQTAPGGITFNQVVTKVPNIVRIKC